MSFSLCDNCRMNMDPTVSQYKADRRTATEMYGPCPGNPVSRSNQVFEQHPCSRCKAEPGHPCTGRPGKHSVHASRLDRALWVHEMYRMLTLNLGDMAWCIREGRDGMPDYLLAVRYHQQIILRTPRAISDSWVLPSYETFVGKFGSKAVVA